MKKLFFLIATLAIMNSYAQNDCATEDIDSVTITSLPWFAKNTWLNNFVDSIEAPFNCANCRLGDGPTRTIYQIPINAIVYDDVNYPNITNAQVEQYISYVNNFYHDNGVLIQFYLKCAIKRIGTSIHANIDGTADGAESGIVLASDNETDCINVHFVNNAPYNGLARLPWMSLKYSCIVRTKNAFQADGYDFRNTLAHELGHCLGLPHTFNKNNCRNDCWQETVSRTRTQESKCLVTIGSRKCEVNGDCFCDTDADIRDNNNYSGNYADCDSKIYNISSTNILPNCKKFDNYGDAWYKTGYTNAMENMMSYWRYGCRTTITKMQRGAMYLYSTKKGAVPLNNNSSSFYSNADIDNYESDNLFHPTLDGNDNIMTVNSKQYHTFHHSSGTACDVDWVYFQNTSSTEKPFIIQTQEVTGKPKPDTKITLFAINSDGTLGAQLATNDDISGTNLFSKITTSNLAASSWFAIKIENKITNTSDTRSKGHYYLRIDDCIDKTTWNIAGPNSICYQNSNYIIDGTNLPVTGTYTYQWSVSPNLTLNSVSTISSALVSIYPNQPATGKGFVRCVVTFLNGCSTVVLEKEVNLYNGSTSPNPSAIISRGDICPSTVKSFEVTGNHKNHFVVTFGPGFNKSISNINWSVNNGYVISDSYTSAPSNHANIYVNSGTSVSITVSGNFNDCSSFSGTKNFSITNKQCTDFDDVARVAQPQKKLTLTIMPIVPNPSSTIIKNQIEVDFENSDDELANKFITNVPEYSIIIYNNNGNVIKEIISNTLSTVLDISMLGVGIYSIVSNLNNQKLSKQFIKN